MFRKQSTAGAWRVWLWQTVVRDTSPYIDTFTKLPGFVKITLALAGNIKITVGSTLGVGFFFLIWYTWAGEEVGSGGIWVGQEPILGSHHGVLPGRGECVLISVRAILGPWKTWGLRGGS